MLRSSSIHEPSDPPFRVVYKKRHSFSSLFPSAQANECECEKGQKENVPINTRARLVFCLCRCLFSSLFYREVNVTEARALFSSSRVSSQPYEYPRPKETSKDRSHTFVPPEKIRRKKQISIGRIRFKSPRFRAPDTRSKSVKFFHQPVYEELEPCLLYCFPSVLEVVLSDNTQQTEKRESVFLRDITSLFASVYISFRTTVPSHSRV